MPGHILQGLQIEIRDVSARDNFLFSGLAIRLFGRKFNPAEKIAIKYTSNDRLIAAGPKSIALKVN